eukprot:3057070-Prymnesium_polylepis.1
MRYGMCTAFFRDIVSRPVRIHISSQPTVRRGCPRVQYVQMPDPPHGSRCSARRARSPRAARAAPAVCCVWSGAPWRLAWGA